MQNTEGPLCKFHACCNAEHLSHYRSISIIESQLKREMIWHTPHFIGPLVVVLHAATDALGRRYESSPVRDYPLVPDVVASISIRGTTPTHFTNCQGFMFSWNSIHVFVPHGHFVSAVTSSGEIGCEANRSDRQHKLSKKSETSCSCERLH